MNIGFETHRSTKEQPRVQVVTYPNPSAAPTVAIIGSGWSIGLTADEAETLGAHLASAARQARHTTRKDAA